MKTRLKAPDTKYFEVKNVTPQSADIFIYDEISSYVPGNNAIDVVGQLRNLKDVPQLNVRINSPGGSVFEGVAIYNALSRHAGNVTTYVDGIAASIASIIALAGKEIHIAQNAMMMIHNPAAYAFGDAAEMRKQADLLDTIKETLINAYVTRTGKERDAIAKMMDDETWFTADQALAAKLVTHTGAALKMTNSFNPKDFGFVNGPVIEVAPPPPPSSTTPRSLLERKQALLEKK